MTTETKPLAELLADLDALQTRAIEPPYFVASDSADDCPEHRNSGLALVDTGRSADWPVARLCEWHTANFIAEIANAYPRLVKELRERIEREQEAMGALDPSMPQSGLVDACKQLKQAYISEADNAIQGPARMKEELIKKVRDMSYESYNPTFSKIADELEKVEINV